MYYREERKKYVHSFTFCKSVFFFFYFLEKEMILQKSQDVECHVPRQLYFVIDFMLY